MVVLGIALIPCRGISAEDLIPLGKHVPAKKISAAEHLGRMSSTSILSLAIPLRSKDPLGLERFSAAVSDPASPFYGQFLTPTEFADRFSPTDAELNAVVQYFRSSGLLITKVHSDRLLIEAEASVKDVEKALQTEIHLYREASGRIFRAPIQEPSVPAFVAEQIESIIGLNNVTLRKHHLHEKSKSVSDAFGGGPHQTGMDPTDIRTAYNIPSTNLTGANQVLGLIEFDGYYPGDITTYESQFGIKNAPVLSNVLISKFSGNPTPPSSDDPTPGSAEVTLDIEMMLAMAPGASKILVYEAPNDGDAPTLAMYHQVATDNHAKTVSSSWGSSEDNCDQNFLIAEQAILQEMAAQGQSVFVAAGDRGAFDDTIELSVEDPCSQPYAVCAGGTTLKLNSNGTYKSETAWSDITNSSGGGGGISTEWPLPAWQQGLGNSGNLGSTTHRMVPDISLNSDPASGYSVFYHGAWTTYGGTSAAAPLWAAFMALVNEQRLTNKSPVIGFPNPILYKLATSPASSASFHDVLAGSTNLYYPTRTGYDLATGLGTFNGAELVDSLVSYVAPNAGPLPTPLSFAPPAANFWSGTVTTSSVEVLWTSGGGSTTGYKLAYKEGALGPTDCSSGPVVSVGNVTNFTLKNLQRDSEYTVLVCSLNKQGEATVGPSINVFTNNVNAPAPTKFKVSSLDSESATLTWVSGGGATTNFRLIVLEGTSAPGCVFPSGKQGETLYIGDVDSFIVGGLTPNTSYVVRVCSFNDDGFPTQGPAVSFKTPSH